MLFYESFHQLAAVGGTEFWHEKTSGDSARGFVRGWLPWLRLACCNAKLSASLPERDLWRARGPVALTAPPVPVSIAPSLAELNQFRNTVYVARQAPHSSISAAVNS
jgi:hypothetical protein